MSWAEMVYYYCVTSFRRVCNGAMHGRQRAQNRLKGVYARLRRAMAPLRTPDRLTTRFCPPEAGEAGTKQGYCSGGHVAGGGQRDAGADGTLW